LWNRRKSIARTKLLATQKVHTYSRFSDAAQDVVNARIYEGIHFRFADEAARRQGRWLSGPISISSDHSTAMTIAVMTTISRPTTIAQKIASVDVPSAT
jgi:hypothetical protein